MKQSERYKKMENPVGKPSSGASVIARLENVSKKYKAGDTTIYALKDASYSFQSHALTLILGPSGSGKTTLLSILGSVIYPSSGEIWIKEQHINKLNQKKLAGIRLKNIGFVFQYFNLIAPLNALENVMQPLILSGLGKRKSKQLAEEALERVNMSDRKNNLPKELSGGQQQRVAIARALVNDPPIILCDEPTASLDQASIKSVMQRLKSLSDEGRAVIIVTHDHRLKSYADAIVYIENGELTDEPNETEVFH
jgi:putative ABC transport system ATP-binding protein